MSTQIEVGNILRIKNAYRTIGVEVVRVTKTQAVDENGTKYRREVGEDGRVYMLGDKHNTNTITVFKPAPAVIETPAVEAAPLGLQFEPGYDSRGNMVEVSIVAAPLDGIELSSEALQARLDNITKALGLPPQIGHLVEPDPAEPTIATEDPEPLDKWNGVKQISSDITDLAISSMDPETGKRVFVNDTQGRVTVRLDGSDIRIEPGEKVEVAFAYGEFEEMPPEYLSPDDKMSWYGGNDVWKPATPQPAAKYPVPTPISVAALPGPTAKAEEARAMFGPNAAAASRRNMLADLLAPKPDAVAVFPGLPEHLNGAIPEAVAAVLNQRQSDEAERGIMAAETKLNHRRRELGLAGKPSNPNLVRAVETMEAELLNMRQALAQLREQGVFANAEYLGALTRAGLPYPKDRDMYVVFLRKAGALDEWGNFTRPDVKAAYMAKFAA